jgi:hypothetical protein
MPVGNMINKRKSHQRPKRFQKRRKSKLRKRTSVKPVTNQELEWEA